MHQTRSVCVIGWQVQPLQKWEDTGLQMLTKTCWDMDIIDMVGAALNRCEVYRYTSSGKIGEVTAIDIFSQFLHSAICCSMPAYASVCIR